MQDRDDLGDSGRFPDPEVDAPGHDLIIIIAVFAAGGLAPLSLLLGALLSTPPLRRFAWDAPTALLGATMALPPVLAVLAVLRWPVGPLARVKQFLEGELAPLLNNSRWDDLALIAIATGVGEEMLFRGVFLPAIAAELGQVWGLLLTSVLFGALHPISIPYAVLSILVGAYLGLVYLYSGNLLAAMTCNGAYVFLVLAYLIRPDDLNRQKRNPIQEIDPDRSIDDPDAS